MVAINRFKFYFLLCLVFLLQACWMPPFDPSLSNSIYLIEEMDYGGVFSQDELNEWGIYIDGGDDSFLSGNVWISPGNSNDPENPYLFSFSNGQIVTFPLSRNESQLNIDGYYYQTQANSNETNSNILYLNDGIPPSGYTHPVSFYYEEPNYEGSGSSQLVFQSIIFNGETNSFENIEYRTPLGNVNSPQCIVSFIDTSWDKEVLVLATEVFTGFFDPETGEEINSAQLVHIEKSELNSTDLIYTSLLQFEHHLVDDVISRDLAYHGSTQRLVLTFYTQQGNYSYILNDTLDYRGMEPLIITGIDQFTSIDSLDSKDGVFASTEEGFFLFQSYSEDEGYILRMWNPDDLSTQKLKLGNMRLVYQYIKNGEYYYAFNFYHLEYGDDQEKREIKLYQISEDDLLDLF